MSGAVGAGVEWGVCLCVVWVYMREVVGEQQWREPCSLHVLPVCRWHASMTACQHAHTASPPPRPAAHLVVTVDGLVQPHQLKGTLLLVACRGGGREGVCVCV